ncbi:predicted protein [Sclerotinia sclerotiorum 1980 UF-70]|uniref:Uncharacterized protein n=1 Tax=Sclerotinia sclerotiorum (strain ATCC 18683 / 1980 / Ss-1) TaxID=665079 RepID=A7ERF2_SCLS1|nr:predicted protein [Sclerotinia sclerotiorum 1980 UF-70]EDN92044.1 predicted protein [Sclerotinia sclerotiorum 1980 UF-70]
MAEVQLLMRFFAFKKAGLSGVGEGRRVNKFKLESGMTVYLELFKPSILSDYEPLKYTKIQKELNNKTTKESHVQFLEKLL